jgi:hypothetical protein
MFLTDLKDQRWKVTLDENGTVYFYVQDKIGREPRVEIPSRELTRYYELENEAKKEFVQTLGCRIGIPFWPLFVDRIIEPEHRFATQLGLFGRMDNESILDQDLPELIVPLPKNQALAEYPHLIPDETTCREYEVQAAQMREAICSSALCAVYCPLFRDDEYKTSVHVTKARLEIESCVICHSPATAVGVFQPRQSDEDIIILHGLCKRCKPKEPCSPKQIEKIGQAIDALEKQGRIQKIQCPLPEA